MKELSDKQRKAAQLMVGGMTGRDVAKAVEVTPETVSVWRSDSTFRAYANSLRNELHQAVRDALRKQGLLAVEALGNLIANASTEETKRKAAVDALSLMGHKDQKSYQMEFASESALQLELMNGPF